MGKGNSCKKWEKINFWLEWRFQIDNRILSLPSFSWYKSKELNSCTNFQFLPRLEKTVSIIETNNWMVFRNVSCLFYNYTKYTVWPKRRLYLNVVEEDITFNYRWAVNG
jgi:hypothetical protein